MNISPHFCILVFIVIIQEGHLGYSINIIMRFINIIIIIIKMYWVIKLWKPNSLCLFNNYIIKIFKDFFFYFIINLQRSLNGKKSWMKLFTISLAKFFVIIILLFYIMLSRQFFLAENDWLHKHCPAQSIKSFIMSKSWE